MQINVPSLLDRNGLAIVPAPMLQDGDVQIAIDGAAFGDLSPLPVANSDGTHTIEIDNVTPETVIVFRDQEDVTDAQWQQEWLDLTIRNITDTAGSVGLAESLQPIAGLIGDLKKSIDKIPARGNGPSQRRLINESGETLQTVHEVIDDELTGEADADLPTNE